MTLKYRFHLHHLHQGIENRMIVVTNDDIYTQKLLYGILQDQGI